MELKDYSKDQRKANINYLLGGKKKVLLVSDFTNRIGGIETYVDDVRHVLHDMGYQTKYIGAHLPRGRLGKILKFGGFFAAMINIWTMIQLLRISKKRKPEVIRYHSIMRYIGRLPLRGSQWSGAEQWMMYHDLGYFYPFPSKLTELKQIKYPLTLANFVTSAHSYNPLIWLAMTGKGILLLLLRQQLQQRIDKHLVPSPFMQDIIHRSYHIAKEDIEVLAHFIQE